MLKVMEKDKPLVMTVKMSKAEHAVLKLLAAEFTKGNISAWLRYAGVNHRPPKSASSSIKD